MNNHKQITLQALETYRGDDHQRAMHHFRHFTEKQMNELHGESGQTRQQILDKYKEHQDKVDLAITWIKSLP